MPILAEIHQVCEARAQGLCKQLENISWWRRGRKPFFFTGFVMLLSIAIPVEHALYQVIVSEKRDFAVLIYLPVLLFAATGGYCIILWSYWAKIKKETPDIAFSKVIFPHLLPLCVLVCITNLALGLFSFFEVPTYAGDGTSAHISSFGVTPMQAFPGAFIPTGTVLLACWGSYFYNCYQMLQRIVNHDFPQSIWISAAFRTAAAILASMLIFAAVFNCDQPSPNAGSWSWKSSIPLGFAMAVSFISGFFPLVTIRQLGRFVLDRISQSSQWFGKFTYTPLTVLDGITSEVQDRLQEAGIDSIQLLAFARIADLKNPNGKALPYAQEILADWIDQARLALYFLGERELTVIRAAGIRTYSALKTYQAAAIQATSNGLSWDWDAIENTGGALITKRQFQAFILNGQFPDLPAPLPKPVN